MHYTPTKHNHSLVGIWFYNISYYKYPAQEFVVVTRDSVNVIVDIRGDTSLDHLISYISLSFSCFRHHIYLSLYLP